MRHVCIHCHCYQPPRENPWLEAIELQDSAYPYHDWNERIMAECYAPNTAARILDDERRIARIVNNFENVSFNFGPTLLSWMKDKAPEGYRSVLEADRASARRFAGHGSALAQCYNHMIMPLANERDKYTQVHWGIEDFRFRFGRMPEGMWLPETAVDLKTLEMLASAGIEFTILAPSQAHRVDGEDVAGSRVDPSRPYRVKLPSGRSLSVFFYDGPISRAVAFEGLLGNGERFADRLLAQYPHGAESEDQLIHIATDGETYGHHHPFGEMALAYALRHIESNGLARITNYGEYLAGHPPASEAEIIENTSWSCVHGVERWASNCGCNSGGNRAWSQAWRGPLRAALDWLRDAAALKFETAGGNYLKDPWAARNEYIHVILDRSAERRMDFASKYFRRMKRPERVKAWKLLEMQRHAMLMYTSCGWFFDELSGLETVQVIQYAGRAVQLARELFGDGMEQEFTARLALARSNLAEHGDGGRIYEKLMKATRIDLFKLGAHYAISSLFEKYPERARIYSYSADRKDYRALSVGKMSIAFGKAQFTSEITQKTALLTFGVLHFGGHGVHAGVRAYGGEREYRALVKGASEAFARADIPEGIRLMNAGFGAETYSLKDLFRDERTKVIGEILKSTLTEAEAAYRQLYDNHAPLLRFLHDARIPVPKEMKSTAEHALNGLLKNALEADDLDFERIRNLLDEARMAGVELDKTTLEFALRKNLERRSDLVYERPLDAARLAAFRDATAGALQLPFELTLWSIQNQCYEIMQTHYLDMLQSRSAGDEPAGRWLAPFQELSAMLLLRPPVE